MPEWKEILQKIEKMVDSGDYEWADETLLGIGETIEDTEYVTDGQREAIQNIEAAG